MARAKTSSIRDSMTVEEYANSEAGQMMSRWFDDALAFTEECLGITEAHGWKISNQQRQLLRLAGPYCRAKEMVYRWRNEGGPEPSEQTKALGSKLGIVVHSGKGTGKDACATWLNLWFMCTRPGAMVVVTAPTEKQLKTVYWSELSRWATVKSRTTHEATFVLKDQLMMDKQKLYMRGVSGDAGRVRNGVSDADGMYWSTFYRVSPKHVDKEKLKGTLSGLHADYQMFILDEAAAIDDNVFEPLENTMTRLCNFALVICNPNRTNGFAHDIFYGRTKDQWLRLRWDAEESDLVSKDLIESLRHKYGADSDNYRVNVKGLPPRGNDDSLIPYEWVFQACNRNLPIPGRGSIILGVDVAFAGGNATYVAARCDNIIVDITRINNTDSIDLANMLMDYINDMERQGYTVAAVVIDKSGTGIGAYHQFLRLYPSVQGVNFGASAKRPDLYRRCRDELWWKVRDQFESGNIQIPDDTELREEFNCLKYKKMSGKVVVSGKDEIKEALGRSCDKADAVMLTYFTDVYDAESRARKRDAWRLEPTIIEGAGGWRKPQAGWGHESPAHDPLSWLYS